jgi:excisionase family DNA binding protein
VKRGDGMDAVSERAPVFPPADEEQRGQLHRLSVALQPNGAPLNGDTSAKLVSSLGKELELPERVYEVLVRVVREMDRGNGITILPVHAELTTQQAAELLNVSRPYLIGLLKRGEIPFHKVGRHRRVRVQDLLDYKERRDSKRRRLLKKVVEEGQEAGLYEK